MLSAICSRHFNILFVSLFIFLCGGVKAQEFTFANDYYRYTTLSPYSGVVYSQNLFGEEAYDIWEFVPRTKEMQLSKIRSYYPPVFANKNNWAAYLDSINQMHICDFVSNSEKVVSTILYKTANKNSGGTYGCSFSPNDKYVLILANPKVFCYSIADGTISAVKNEDLIVTSPYDVMYDWADNDSTLILMKNIDNYTNILLSYNFITDQTDTLVYSDSIHMMSQYRPFAYNQQTGKLFYATTSKTSADVSLHSYDLKTKTDNVIFYAPYISNSYGILDEIGGLTWSPDWTSLAAFSYGLDLRTNLHVYYGASNVMQTYFKYIRPEQMFNAVWLNNDTLIYQKVSSLCGYAFNSTVDIKQPSGNGVDYHIDASNYPNPFNPSTRIDYALPEAAVVQIKIYTLTGALVKTLVNEYKEAGYYSADFNAATLPSGVYFYRMTAGNQNLVKKLMVLK